jgi:hypothetical protein
LKEEIIWVLYHLFKKIEPEGFMLYNFLSKASLGIYITDLKAGP